MMRGTPAGGSGTADAIVTENRGGCGGDDHQRQRQLAPAGKRTRDDQRALARNECSRRLGCDQPEEHRVTDRRGHAEESDHGRQAASATTGEASVEDATSNVFAAGPLVSELSARKTSPMTPAPGPATIAGAISQVMPVPKAAMKEAAATANGAPSVRIQRASSVVAPPRACRIVVSLFVAAMVMRPSALPRGPSWFASRSPTTRLTEAAAR